MDDLKPEYSEGNADFVRELPTIGEHQAVCSQIHNIGHQLYQGKASISPKVTFIFEIDQKVAEGKFAGHQMIVAKEFAHYMSADCDLRKFLSAWRGQPMTDAEAKEVTLRKLIGIPCTLVIIHNPGKGQNAMKVYPNIAAITPAKKGAPRVPVLLADVPEWVMKKKAAAVAPPDKKTASLNMPKDESDTLPF